MVPFARACFIMGQVEDEATEAQLKELLGLMEWAFAFDREHDWTWHFKQCPLLHELPSYQLASDLVHTWFNNNQFPIHEKWQEEYNIFENWILPVLDEWVERKFEEHYQTSTWYGVKGMHAVHWNSEKEGHVVVFNDEDFEPIFDYKL